MYFTILFLRNTQKIICPGEIAENGNDIQKWMGVYHDASFVNYKTYLTFDKDGNEQRSSEEKEDKWFSL